MFSILPAALVLFVLASLFKISFIYNVSYVLFGVYVLAALWSRRSLTDLRCRRRYQERALLGDVVTVTLEVQNRGWLPVPWVQFHDRLPLALISPPFYRTLVSLQPRETRTFSYELHCRQRGWYQIGPLTAQLGDVFGLNDRHQDFSAGAQLTVYPKILPIDELGLPSKSPFGHLRTRQLLYEDPSRVIGVREYQSGDSLRNVNWKVTASSGRLQVKKLEPAMTLETVVLLNLNTTEYNRSYVYSASEMAIVVAASIANHLASLRQEVGLLTNGIDPADPHVGALAGYLPRKGRAQLASILELLGRVTVVAEQPFLPALRAEVKRLPWGATLVVVTPRETEELLETALPLRRAGFNVVLIYVDYPNPEPFEAAHQRAAMLGMRAHRVWREEDVDVWRRQVQSAV
ncbi:MAG TPA: DUF58 domain-containing protein [Chloroflexota bacterium]|nr:DUF58 domain-containing protein [Chloroflexota bacterium]